MDTSIFTDSANKPTESELISGIGNHYQLWQSIIDLVYQKFPKALSEWNFPGQKYGWSFRIKDKKRAIIYLLRRDKCFMVAFVFGQKAYDKIMESSIAENIKEALASARVYAEGRGIRIEVKDKKMLKDISKLIDIKLTF